MKNQKIIVIKVGSKPLVFADGAPNHLTFKTIAAEIAAAQALGWRVVLLTSGATLLGLGKALDLKESVADDIMRGRIAAGIGQPELAYLWQQALSPFGIRGEQILTTHAEIANGVRTEFIELLLELGIVPIINEDDTRSAEEMKAYITEKGDNDKLTCHIAKAICAERVFLLTDVDGVCVMSPAGKPIGVPIPVIERVDETIWRLVCQNASSRPTGMGSKLEAADKLQRAGITVHIAHAAKWVIIPDLEGKLVGTTFPAH